MVRNRSLLLLGLLCYVVFMLALLPISQLGKKVEGVVAKWVDVKSIEGTFWSASTAYRVLNLPSSVATGRINWNPSLRPLILLQLGGAFEISHPGLDLSLIASRGFDEATLSNIDGSIQARFLNQILEKIGAQLTGEIRLNDLLVTRNLTDGRYSDAEGSLLYEGGRVSAVIGGQKENLKMPAITAQLRVNDGNLIADVMIEETNVLIVAIQIQPDGWMQVVVYQSLMKLLGKSQANVKDSDEFINIKQQIFDILEW